MIQAQPALPQKDWAQTIHEVNHVITSQSLNEDQIATICTILEDISDQFDEVLPILQSSPQAIRELELILSKTIQVVGSSPSTHRRTISLCQEIFTRVTSAIPQDLDSKIINCEPRAKSDVIHRDAELLQFSKQLLTDIPNYHAKQKWQIENPGKAEDNPYLDTEVISTDFQILFFHNLKDRLNAHPEKLPSELVKNLAQLLEAYYEYNEISVDIANYLVNLSLEHGLILPKCCLLNTLNCFTTPQLAGLLASKQFNRNFSAKDLESILRHLSHRANELKPIIAQGLDRNELRNLIEYIFQYVLKYPSAQPEALTVKEVIFQLENLVTMKGFLPPGYCPEVQEYFNCNLCITLFDGIGQCTSAELLGLRKISPVIEGSCAFHDTNKLPDYDWSKMHVTKEEFENLIALVRSSDNRVAHTNNAVLASTRARFLFIEHMQKGYEQQILQEIESGFLNYEKITELFASEEVDFSDDFKQKLLIQLLDLMDKLAINEENFQMVFDLYQLSLELAEQSKSIELFINRMLVHFPALIEELNLLKAKQEVEEADYNERIDEMKTLVALINPKTLKDRCLLYNLSKTLSIETQAVTQKEIYDEVRKELNEPMPGEHLRNFIKSIIGMDPKIDVLCMNRIIDHLIVNGVSHIEFNLLAQLFDLGIETATKGKSLTRFADAVYGFLPTILMQFISAYINHRWTTKEIEPRLQAVKTLLQALKPLPSPFVLDLSNLQIVAISQLRVLSSLPIDKLRLKNWSWFNRNRFHRNDRHEVQKLFPNTKIDWL